jgi:hypothetical protein
MIFRSFFLVINGLIFAVRNEAYLTKFSRLKVPVLSATGSLGSDLLERPEDENSPEFKEYLRSLLTMQANRAKSGFAAPSRFIFHYRYKSIIYTFPRMRLICVLVAVAAAMHILQS